MDRNIGKWVYVLHLSDIVKNDIEIRRGTITDCQKIGKNKIYEVNLHKKTIETDLDEDFNILERKKILVTESEIFDTIPEARLRGGQRLLKCAQHLLKEYHEGTSKKH